MKKVNGFDVEAYQRRLRLMREILTGDNQMEFAERLGISFKRWSNYERGYPMPRETAWILDAKFGVSIEWIWYGRTGGLTADFQNKLKAAEHLEREREAAQRQIDRGKRKLEQVNAKKRKVTRSRPKSRASHQAP